MLITGVNRTNLTLFHLNNVIKDLQDAELTVYNL
ncbi:MAG: hypothetical protein ACI836_000227 [Saprospiraceae bacterium]|jgi:hypothetical protein